MTGRPFPTPHQIADTGKVSLSDLKHGIGVTKKARVEPILGLARRVQGRNVVVEFMWHPACAHSRIGWNGVGLDRIEIIPERA